MEVDPVTPAGTIDSPYIICPLATRMYRYLASCSPCLSRYAPLSGVVRRLQDSCSPARAPCLFLPTIAVAASHADLGDLPSGLESQ